MAGHCGKAAVLRAPGAPAVQGRAALLHAGPPAK